ncbi:fatty acid hydroxylase 1 [Artemisia annua]|uniref:Fatty acid hydroxylase 1 n=1 Tax=Artemisia annua TaxID=35608 RepID=A0A2U1P7A3_ARTAN|nr:fatty acid hydroxylase 1 [Artemisia annua]
MVAQEFTVDLNKPLVFQVGHLGEAYQEWVHQPIVSVEGPRFFASDFWEFLTKNEWYVIPTIWLPVVCWYATKAFKMGNSLPEIAMILVLGIFIWTLMEYSLHRFLFHIKTKTYWGNTLHYLLHGCHHKHPQDGLRLVFPPTATAILLFPFLTKNEWYVIPTIWLPVVCWYATKAFKMGNSLPEIAMILVLGIFIWTLMEYSLHRFLFHIKTKTYWGNTLHYLLHGCHHKHPQDGLRLVFPPTATAILLFPLWNIVKLISTPAVAPALFAGILLGYVMYDVTHYYLHHGQPKSEVPKHLKKYHLNHHFRIQNKGYGITSSLWDKVSSNFENPVVARLHVRFQSNHAHVTPRQCLRLRCLRSSSHDPQGLSDPTSSSIEQEGESSNESQGKSSSSSEILNKLRRYGISGILSYGLLNTAYYLSAFLVAWFYIAPAPGKMGYWTAVKRFVKLMAMVWAGSQVTKLARLGGALALAPIVDKGLSWFMAKFKFESQAKAFSVIVGCCFGLAAVLFIIVTLLSA